MKKGNWRVCSFAILLFLSTLSVPLSAQNWEVGTTLGLSLYNGDIPIDFPTVNQQVRFGGSLFVRKRLNWLFAVRAQVQAGQLFMDEKRFGSSEWKKQRGFAFTSPIYELAILPEIRPFKIGNVEFLAFAGVAAAGFNPKTDFNEPSPIASFAPDFVDLIAADKKATSARMTLAIPIGGGLQWFINDRFTIGGEVGGRTTFSDYLDGISLAARPKTKDYYYFGGLTLSYFFGDGNSFSDNWGRGGRGKGGGVNCPTF
jgi:Domain of unknown function (DUF6089)